MAEEQRHIDYIFIDLQGGEFRGLNRESVSLHSASLHIGRHLTCSRYRSLLRTHRGLGICASPPSDSSAQTLASRQRHPLREAYIKTVLPSVDKSNE